MKTAKNDFSDEKARVTHIYSQRDARLKSSDYESNIYHPRHPLGLMFIEHNQASLIKALNQLKVNLAQQRILDLGCGYGNWLRRFIELGADPTLLVGTDISAKRIHHATKSNPAISWIQSDSIPIPFMADCYDIVMQVVVFSSIIDGAMHTYLARELCRVVKPGGYILWVDHKASFSEKLAGFGIQDVLNLFPGTEMVYTDRVHPRYFRRMYQNYSWLARLLYSLTRWNCDSWFFVLRMEA